MCAWGLRLGAEPEKKSLPAPATEYQIGSSVFIGSHVIQMSSSRINSLGMHIQQSIRVGLIPKAGQGQETVAKNGLWRRARGLAQ
jgi:hypothetical protein